MPKSNKAELINRPNQQRRTIRFRRRSHSLRPKPQGHWRLQAELQRANPVDPRSVANNAAMFALCGSLFDAMQRLSEERCSPASAHAASLLDAIVDAAESELGVEAPVMGPLVELFDGIRVWQREHLVDETTLIEVLLARIVIGLTQTSSLRAEDVFSDVFADAFEGLPPALRA